MLFSVAAFAQEPTGKADDEPLEFKYDDEEERQADEELSPLAKYLRDNFYFRTHLSIRGHHLINSDEPRPGRALGLAWGSITYDPISQIQLLISGWGRAPLDFSLTGVPDDSAAQLVPFGDIDDSRLKIKGEDFSLHLGALVVPWQVTRGVALTDRINPRDYRRGPMFPSMTEQKIPQYGFLLRNSIGEATLETLGFIKYRAPLGSLVPTRQGGISIGRYQNALARSSIELKQIASTDDRGALNADVPWVTTPVFAARVKHRLGIVDASLSAVWGFNEVPSIQLNDEGNIDVLTYDRAISFGVDATTAIGVLVLKLEALLQPNFGAAGHKTAVLKSDGGLSTIDTGFYAFSAALEGSYGELFSASLEVFDEIWIGIPANQKLWGVELMQHDASIDRAVHRFALGLTIEGEALESALQWKFVADIGISQPDISAGVDLNYQWQKPRFYVGAFANGFTGLEGSPGWMRQQATTAGFYVGHRLN